MFCNFWPYSLIIFQTTFFLCSELSLAYHHEQNAIKSIISGLSSQNQHMLTQNYQNSLIKLRCAQINQDMLIATLIETSKLSSITPEIAEHLLVCLMHVCFTISFIIYHFYP